MARTGICRLIAILAVGAGAWCQALAQTPDGWPSRPVRLIVPGSAGTGGDLFARALAIPLGKALGQPIVVDDRVGANGIIGNDLVAKAPPDGYTVLFGNSSALTLNAAIRSDLPYDAVKDLKPVIMLATGGILLAALPGIHVSNVKEFLAYVRAHPGMSYGSWGVGSNGHVSMEALSEQEHLRMQHVPYRAMSALLAGLLGGEVDIAFIDVLSAAPLVRSGKLVPVAVTGTVRMPNLSEVATMREQGIDLGFDGWYGLFVPAKTPEAIVDRLYAESMKIRKDPQWAKTFSDFNLPPVPDKSTSDFAATIRAEIPYWRRIVEAAGIKPE